MFLRRTSKNGYVTWVCRTHDRSADACHVGRIPESEIRAAFLRMYRKLKCNADMILKPAMEQMNALDAILQQNNPKTLTINRAIAEATEESHKISTLRVNGLLDADTCTARMNVISAKRRSSAGNGAGWRRMKHWTRSWTRFGRCGRRFLTGRNRWMTSTMISSKVSWKRSSRNLKQRFVSDSMAGWN